MMMPPAQQPPVTDEATIYPFPVRVEEEKPASPSRQLNLPNAYRALKAVDPDMSLWVIRLDVSVREMKDGTAEQRLYQQIADFLENMRNKEYNP